MFANSIPFNILHITTRFSSNFGHWRIAFVSHHHRHHFAPIDGRTGSYWSLLSIWRNNSFCPFFLFELNYKKSLMYNSLETKLFLLNCDAAAICTPRFQTRDSKQVSLCYQLWRTSERLHTLNLQTSKFFFIFTLHLHNHYLPFKWFTLFYLPLLLVSEEKEK